ncbi:MAG TPA: RimK family alpha-L-glutamate ligase [Gemmataceae bacterium]|nr:RimK family alpha-L-glutamate ligase [Gemmataceae bacterium]
MRFAILSSGSGWHVRDLQRAAARLGHEAVAVDFRRLHAGVAVTADPLAGYDGVLVRTMPPGSLEQVVFRMDLLHRLRARGVPVLNPPAAVEVCVDKYLASARLEAAGLRVPPTVVCQHADAALEAFAALGGDVIVKPLFGSEGRGMLRLTDPDLAWRTFRTLERLQSVLYLQRFIPHPGWDLRILVLDGRCPAAMRRYSNGGWRTNVAQGGTAEPARLSAAEEELALRAAAAVGAPVAGVDLLPGPAGEWYVLEVNAVPGWRALAPVTGVDIAVEMVRFLAGPYQTR